LRFFVVNELLSIANFYLTAVDFRYGRTLSAGTP